MGLLDQLALRAAGVAGKYQGGRLAGEQERYKRDTTSQARRDDLERQALERALLEQRNQELTEYRRGMLNSRDNWDDFVDEGGTVVQVNRQTGERRQLPGLRKQPVKPEGPERGVVVEESDKQILIDPTTGRPIARFGAKPKTPQVTVLPGPEGQIYRVPRAGGEATPVATAGGPLRVQDKTRESAIRENRSRLAGVEGALAIARANPDAFGLKNVLGETVMQRLDPEGSGARGEVANIGSLKISDRSGATVPVGEMQRLRPFVPDASDRPDKVVRDLERFLVEYRRVLDELEEGYSIAEVDARPAAPAPKKSKRSIFEVVPP